MSKDFIYGFIAGGIVIAGVRYIIYGCNNNMELNLEYNGNKAQLLIGK